MGEEEWVHIFNGQLMYTFRPESPTARYIIVNFKAWGVLLVGLLLQLNILENSPI
jgi:hypothetical protein